MNTEQIKEKADDRTPEERKPILHIGNVPDDMELAMSMEGWAVYTRKNPDKTSTSIKIIRTVLARKGNYWLLFNHERCEFLPHSDLTTLAVRHPQEFRWLLNFLLPDDDRQFFCHTILEK